MPPTTRSRPSAVAESPKPSSRAASVEPQRSASPVYVPSHPIFFDSRNDVVLRAQGTPFAFRSAVLKEASDVFATMFEDGVDDSKAQTEGGCPMLDLDDDADTLESYLIFIHPQIAGPNVDSLKELESLCAIADKYNSRLLLQSLILKAKELRTGSLRTGAAAMLALAIVHDVPQLLCDALRGMGGDFSLQSTSRGGHKYKNKTVTLKDMPSFLYKRFAPSNIFYLLSRFEYRLLSPAHQDVSSWAFAADEIVKDSKSMEEAASRLAAWCKANNRWPRTPTSPSDDDPS